MEKYQKAIELAPQFAKAHFELGMELLAAGKAKQAVPRLGEALRHNPHHAEAHRQLGLLMLNSGRASLALPQLRATLKERKEDPQAHYEVGLCLARLGRYEEAIASYREAMRLRAEWPEAANQLAWLLATCPDEKFRNGEEALRLASRGVGMTQRRQTFFLDTLAAAEAESGRFDAALATQKKAIEQAKALGDEKLTAELEKRVAVYSQKKPFREERAEVVAPLPSAAPQP